MVNFSPSNASPEKPAPALMHAPSLAWRRCALSELSAAINAVALVAAVS